MNWNPHPFSLRQLQYALAVADTEGFRKAAQQCHVSQPSLSAQVAQLESVLGVTLFDRSGRAVQLLPGARELLGRMRALLVDAEALQVAGQQLADPLSGPLRIGVIPTLSPYLVPWLVAPVRQAFARLRPLWVEAKTVVIRRGLEDGALDAGLVALEAEYGTVESEVLGSDRFVFAAPKGHRLARGKGPLPIELLQQEELLLLEEGHCLRDQALSFCSGLTEHDFGVKATSLSTLAQMVASGSGVTLLPQLSIAQENPHGRLACRALAAPIPSRTVALIWRHRSAWTQPMRQVASVMRGALANRLTAPPPLRVP